MNNSILTIETTKLSTSKNVFPIRNEPGIYESIRYRNKFR